MPSSSRVSARRRCPSMPISRARAKTDVGLVERQRGRAPPAPASSEYSTARRGPPIGRRRREMVRQVGERRLRCRGWSTRLQRLGDAEVQLGAAQDTGMPIVQRAAHQLVREPVGQPGKGTSSIIPCAIAGSRAAMRSARQRRPAQDVELELRPGDGGQLEQVSSLPDRAASGRWLTTSRTLSRRRRSLAVRRQPELPSFDRDTRRSPQARARARSCRKALPSVSSRSARADPGARRDRARRPTGSLDELADISSS